MSPGAEALLAAARNSERDGEFAGARGAYEQVLRGLTNAAEASLAATLFRRIGDTHRDEGDAEAACDCYELSRTVAELNGDDVNVAHALNSRGILEWQWGRFDEAFEFYRSARALADEVGETRLAAMVDQNTGVLANIQGDLLGALRHYGRSLEGYRRLGDVQRMAGVLSNLGMLHTDLAQWDEAEQKFAESSQLSEQVGDLRSRAMVEVNRTELYLLKGDLERASESCDAASELASRTDHHLALGEVHKNYGIIYRETRKLALAEMHLEKAAEVAQKYANPLLSAEVQREIARVYRQQERNRDALQALIFAHRVFTELKAQPDLADVGQHLRDLEGIFLDVVRRWGDSIESKDRYTAGHCERVAELSCLLAEAAGIEETILTWFRMGAFLHDVGKTAVPASILNKEGPLTDDEWAIMRNHTIAGVELLSPIEFPWDIRPMVRSHHERWDGRGYPDGIAGPDIPITARILCVADAFDALTSTRSYRDAFAPEKALEIMARDAGAMFDPDLFVKFEAIIRRRLEAGDLEVGA